MNKKSGKFSKFIVIFVIIMNVMFTLLVLDVVVKTGVEPSTLIASWFAFTTGELWMLSSIKKTKTKNESQHEMIQEECLYNEEEGVL